MIARIEGTIIHKNDKFVVVNTESGLGYKVYLASDALAGCDLGLAVSFWIYTAVREDAMDLYGFGQIGDMEFFELLLDISGIGPKSALGIMSIASVESLSEAIATGNTGYLTKVSGIGKKTAERIVVELRDKMLKTGTYSKDNLQGESDALEALHSLGYGEREAREALKEVGAKGDTSDRVKMALKILSKK